MINPKHGRIITWTIRAVLRLTLADYANSRCGESVARSGSRRVAEKVRHKIPVGPKTQLCTLSERGVVSL